MIDFLVVGQGLAGTLLTHALKDRGQRVLVVDDHHRQSSTAVAAGIMNPITGRRFVKSWMYDTLVDDACRCYRRLEERLGVQLLHPMNVLRVFGDQKAENDWHARRGSDAYAPYMREEADLGGFEGKVRHTGRYGEVQGSYQVKLLPLMQRSARQWEADGTLRRQPFRYEDLVLRDDSAQYHDISAKAVVFCEGHQVTNNPWFGPLTLLRKSKGQVLHLKIPHLKVTKMIKHRYFIVPMDKERYWFGPADAWQFEDDAPDAQARSRLADAAAQMIVSPLSVLDHQAAIRPTVRDRRPILGRHPSYSCLYLFNGLGTKGSSLGPYWAGRMTAHLLDQVELPPAVRLERFIS